MIILYSHFKMLCLRSNSVNLSDLDIRNQYRYEPENRRW